MEHSTWCRIQNAKDSREKDHYQLEIFFFPFFFISAQLASVTKGIKNVKNSPRGGTTNEIIISSVTAPTQIQRYHPKVRNQQA
jgi:hypothetical protein